MCLARFSYLTLPFDGSLLIATVWIEIAITTRAVTHIHSDQSHDSERELLFMLNRGLHSCHFRYIIHRDGDVKITSFPGVIDSETVDSNSLLSENFDFEIYNGICSDHCIFLYPKIPFSPHALLSWRYLHSQTPNISLIIFIITIIIVTYIFIQILDVFTSFCA